MGFLKRYLLAGLLLWLPLIVTVFIVDVLVGFFDQVLVFVPEAWRPEALIGHDLPGLGIVITLLVVVFTGFLVTNMVGRQLMRLWEGFLDRIPLVRTIYHGVKQIAEAVFGNGSQSFQNVYLIEYPRRGLWTVAFQTSLSIGEAQIKVGGDSVVNVFVPTTPNPTSGFFLMVDRSELIDLEMSVDEALKMVISGGVVVPPSSPEKLAEWKKINQQKESAKNDA
jgi:uncharacterized membrane protein